MKHREYFTAYVEFEDGKAMSIMGDKMKRRFETLEETKDAIEKLQRSYARKNMTRTYADGTKVRLSYSDIHNLRYVIQRHIEDYEIVDEITTTKTINDNEKDIKEEAIRL